MEFHNLLAGSSPRPSYEGWVTAALAPNLLQNTSKPGERNTSEYFSNWIWHRQKPSKLSNSLNTGNPTCPLDPQRQLVNQSLQSQGLRNMATESTDPTENIKSEGNIWNTWTTEKAVVTTFLELKNYPRVSNGSTAGWSELWMQSIPWIVHGEPAILFHWGSFESSLNVSFKRNNTTFPTSLKNYLRVPNGWCLIECLQNPSVVTVQLHGRLGFTAQCVKKNERGKTFPSCVFSQWMLVFVASE